MRFLLLLLLSLQVAKKATGFFNIPSSLPTPQPTNAPVFGGGVAPPPPPPAPGTTATPTLVSQIGTTPQPTIAATRPPVVLSPIPIAVAAASPAPPPPSPTLVPTSTPFPTVVQGHQSPMVVVAGSGLNLATISSPPINLGRGAAAASTKTTAAVAATSRRESMSAEFASLHSEASLLDDVSSRARALAAGSPTPMPSQAGSSSYQSFWATTSFTGLGQPSMLSSRPNWFLNIDLFDTGFGGHPVDSTFNGNVPPLPKQQVGFFVRTKDQVGYQLIGRCRPLKKLEKNACPAAELYKAAPLVIECTRNFEVTSLIQNDFGGSLQIYMASEGFADVNCPYFVPNVGLSAVVARFTLTAMHPNPTEPPVEKPGLKEAEEEEEEALEDDEYEGDDDHARHEIHDAAHLVEIPESHGVPIQAICIPLGFLVYILMGIRILIVHSKYHSNNITPAHAGAVLFYFALLGIHLCLEMAVGIILIESHWDVELGYGILFSRLCCWVPSFYILGTVFHTGFYEKRLEEDQLSANVVTYGIFNLFVISDTQLLSYFPWATTAFSKVNYGLPDVERVHFSLWPKLCQTIVSLICTSIFLNHVHEEILWVQHHQYETHDDEHHDDYVDDEHHVTGEYTDDEHDDHHDDAAHWHDLQEHFLHQLMDLDDLVTLLLVFTVFVMVSVFYSMCKHSGAITPNQQMTPDMYDDKEQEHERRPSEAGDNRFLQRNLEMAHNPIQLPPNGGRLSFSQQPAEFYGGAPGSNEFGAPQPVHPYGLQDRRPSFEAGPRMNMQAQMASSSFQGRASLDGRRSSLGLPQGGRRPSFDTRLPAGPPPGMHGPPPGHH